MDRKRKLMIWIGSAVAVIALLGIVGGRVAEHRIRTSLSNLPGAEINPGKLHVSIFSGNIEMQDVAFAVHDSTQTKSGIQGSVKSLKLKGLRYIKLLKREVSFSELKVDDGSLKGILGNVDLFARDFGYRFADSLFVCNDSIYSISLDSLDYVTRDSLVRIQVAHLEQTNAGPLSAQTLHIYNDVPQEKLAIKMGKVAAMWFDLTLDSLTTSPVKIPGLMQKKGMEVEKIFLSGPKAVIFQDDRFGPKVPYPTLQESINAVGMPIKIDTVNARFESFNFIWETTHVNRGTFPMQNVRLKLTSVGNAPDNVMGLRLRTGLPGKSSMDMSASIHNDKEETINGKLRIETLDASKLDGFLRPLFGATIRADIHKADCTFKGNKHTMDSHFEMLYDNLEVHAWNDSKAPYRVVANNNGVMNFLANILLPKANPTKSGQDPRVVDYNFHRDVKTPYIGYLIQNITYGMLHTLLPDHTIQKIDQDIKNIDKDIKNLEHSDQKTDPTIQNIDEAFQKIGEAIEGLGYTGSDKSK